MTWSLLQALRAWARWWCRAQSTRMSFMCTSQPSGAGRPAVVRKTLGSKLIKMTYSDDAGHGRQVKIVDTTEHRAQPLLYHGCRGDGAGQAGPHHKQHDGRPMDIEWAKDGQDGQLYIVQARPETVRSRQGGQHPRTLRP
ncbi:PEP/pyruvate-binding domain-containing protein [Escherichia coli]